MSLSDDTAFPCWGTVRARPRFPDAPSASHCPLLTVRRLLGDHTLPRMRAVPPPLENIPQGGIYWRVASPPFKIYPRGVYTGEQYRPIPPTRRSFPIITSPPRLLPMASHGCSCCGPASRADTVSIPAASDSSAGGSSSSYQVTGLTCGHCAKSVTQALQALPQVDDVQVDLAAGGVSTVTVTGVVPPETVRRAIEATGYTVLS